MCTDSVGYIQSVGCAISLACKACQFTCATSPGKTHRSLCCCQAHIVHAEGRSLQYGGSQIALFRTCWIGSRFGNSRDVKAGQETIKYIRTPRHVSPEAACPNDSPTDAAKGTKPARRWTNTNIVLSGQKDMKVQQLP